MEIHQIKYFSALCETLNFTRAAERCNVTQPSLTRAIKQLEDELGGPLFHRERANTHLTELGRLMRPHLAQVLSEIEAAKDRANEARKLERSTLTVGVMCTIGPTKLIELIGALRRNYPETNLQLRDAKGCVLQEMLIAGELEAAIFGLPDPLDERLHLMPLFDERFVITMPPGHRFEAFSAIRCDDLQGEAFVSRANCEFHDHVLQVFAQRGIVSSQSYLSEREDWCLAMILAGIGIGFTPEHAAGLQGLQSRPLIEPEFVRTINIATVRGRPYSPAIGAFMREAMAWRARGCPAPGGALRAA